MEFIRSTHFWSFAQALSRAGLDLFFPPRCVSCGQRGSDWCDGCQRSLDLIMEPLCMRCGAPLSGNYRLCNHCRRHPFPLQARSYARYEGALMRALLHLKYRPNRRLGATMSVWLAEVCSRHAWHSTIVIPVPLGRLRHRQRGYNQTELIARPLAEALGLRHHVKALRRTRETASQVGLDIVQRQQNVQGAFQAFEGVVKGQRVLLVDDLMTTGATIIACGNALREAGAEVVHAVTVARA